MPSCVEDCFVSSKCFPSSLYCIQCGKIYKGLGVGVGLSLRAFNPVDSGEKKRTVTKSSFQL